MTTKPVDTFTKEEVADAASTVFKERLENKEADAKAMAFDDYSGLSDDELIAQSYAEIDAASPGAINADDYAASANTPTLDVTGTGSPFDSIFQDAKRSIADPSGYQSNTGQPAATHLPHDSNPKRERGIETDLFPSLTLRVTFSCD